MIARLGKLATSCRVSVHHMVTMFTHLKSTLRSISRASRTLTRAVSLRGLNSLTLSLWMKIQDRFSRWCETIDKPTFLERQLLPLTLSCLLAFGFGLLHTIGGLSRAATSILRQLIDAGTLSNLPAGFKARGVRIRNDDERLLLASSVILMLPVTFGMLLCPFHTRNLLGHLLNYWALSSIQEDDLPKSPTQNRGR